MKLKFKYNRKIHDGRVYMDGNTPVLDLPHITDKTGVSIKYIDRRPLYTLTDSKYPKFYEGDGFVAVVHNEETNETTLVVRSTIDVIEEVSNYPADKPLVWVRRNVDTHYVGLSKKHFDKIKYIPVYEEEEG